MANQTTAGLSTAPYPSIGRSSQMFQAQSRRMAWFLRYSHCHHTFAVSILRRHHTGSSPKIHLLRGQCGNCRKSFLFRVFPPRKINRHFVDACDSSLPLLLVVFYYRVMALIKAHSQTRGPFVISSMWFFPHRYACNAQG